MQQMELCNSVCYTLFSLPIAQLSSIKKSEVIELKKTNQDTSWPYQCNIIKTLSDTSVTMELILGLNNEFTIRNASSLSGKGGDIYIKF